MTEENNNAEMEKVVTQPDEVPDTLSEIEIKLEAQVKEEFQQEKAFLTKSIENSMLKDSQLNVTAHVARQKFASFQEPADA